MSQKTTQIKIGLFLLLAATLLASSLFFFGITTIFQNNVGFVSFFTESVRGLDKGSKVRYRGVQVGEVKSVQISLGPSVQEPGTAVVYEIDFRHLRDKLGVDVQPSEIESLYRKLMESGLTAKLENESLLTGQLFINLNLEPSRSSEPKIYLEDLHWIPTTPSLMANFADKTVQIADHLSQIDFAAISKNLNNVLIHLDRNLEDIDMGKLSDNLNLTLEQVQKSLNEVDLAERSKQLGLLADEMHKLLQFIREEGESIAPDLKESISGMNESLEEITTTFKLAQIALTSRDGTVAQIDETLRDLQMTLQSVRYFVDFLRRNPNALLFGVESK